MTDAYRVRLIDAVDASILVAVRAHDGTKVLA
jgi:hypothetical protein